MMSRKREIDVDSVLNSLGGIGPYQITQLIFIVLDYFSAACILLSFVFIGFYPDFHCKPLDEDPSSNGTNLTTTKTNFSDVSYVDKCSVQTQVFRNGSVLENKTISCINGYHYEVPKDRSLISEWDLVCEKSGLGELTQTLFIIGEAFGSVTLTPLSDRYGRRPVHITGHILLFIICFGASFIPSYWAFAGLRIFIGILFECHIVPSFAMLLELFPTNRRTTVAGVFGVIWGACLMLLSPIAYLLQDHSWRVLFMILSFSAAASVIEYWFQDESLRWLCANGKLDQCKTILKKAAKQNKVSFNEIWYHHIEPVEELAMLSCKTSEHDETALNSESYGSPISNHSDTKNAPEKSLACGISSILRERSLRNILFIMVYVWMVNNLIYFGLYFMSHTLAGNRFLNFFLTSACELPAAFIVIKSLSRLGRKKTMIAFQTVACLSLLAALISKVMESDNGSIIKTSTIFSYFGMFGIAGSYGAVWIYTPEIFPTNSRTVALGVCIFSSQIGGVMATFSTVLARNLSWLPGTLFSIGCILGNFLLFFLPETSNRQLPQTVEEFRSWKREKNTKNIRETTADDPSQPEARNSVVLTDQS